MAWQTFVLMGALEFFGYSLSLEGLRELLTIFGTNAYVQAAVVIVASVVVAKIADFIIIRGLAPIARRTPLDIDNRLLQLLHQPIFYSVLLVGLGVAVQILPLLEGLETSLVSLFKTLVILVWMFFGMQLAGLILSAMAGQPDRFQVVQPATLPLFEISSKVILIGAAVYFFFVSWGIDVTGWAASAGIIGIAVGFAARDTLANLFAGVFILADAPYKIGDFIVLEGGDRGQVTRIGLRSTRILTRDDIEITIPNSTIANSKIINESGGPWKKERLRIRVGVAYGSNIDTTREALLEAAAQCDLIAQQPEPRVRFREFGDSSLNFDLLCWIDEPVLRGRAQDAMLTLVYKCLGQKGVEIPFPKRDLYIRELPPGLPANFNREKPKDEN